MGDDEASGDDDGRGAGGAQPEARDFPPPPLSGAPSYGALETLHARASSADAADIERLQKYLYQRKLTLDAWLIPLYASFPEARRPCFR